MIDTLMEKILSIYEQFFMNINVSILIILLFFAIKYVPEKLVKFIHVIERNKTILLIWSALAFLGGTYIYSQYYGLPPYQAIYYSLIQFVLDIKTPAELGITTDLAQDNYDFIYWSGFAAMIASSLTLLLLFKQELLSLKAKALSKEESKIIICGLGENNRYFIDNILTDETGKKNKISIYIIEKDILNPYIENYNQYDNVVVVQGDAQDAQALKKALITQCQFCIISTGSDIVNLSIASKIREYEESKQSDDKEYITMHVHVSRRDSEIFFDEIEFLGKEASKNTHFYSYNELASRKLFEDFSLIDSINTVNSEEEVHVLIIGFGDLGQEVALQAALQGHFYNQKPINITVVDTDKKQFEAFRAIHWNIEDICNFSTYVCDVSSHLFYENYINQKVKPTHVIFTLGDDMLTFSSLSVFIHRLRQNYIKEKSPLPNIAVRFKKTISKKIIKTYEEKMDTQKFHVFGVTSIISTKEFIIEHSVDALAKQIYDKYTKSAADKELPAWDHLSNFYKDSNRASADHQIIKRDTLKRLGLSSDHLEDFEDATQEIFENEIYYGLVDMEHRRWKAFHLLNGFESYKLSEDELIEVCQSQDYENKLKKNKLHICIVPTKELLPLAKKTKKEDEYHYYKHDLNTYIPLLKGDSNGN